ncbi:TIGR02680 family protein [Rhodococcus triatomae]|uniref:TIGR02680 family protein n=1 Tax=Rhodococcus triatomae TaxID=300028 RepID=A0A1G8P7B9_9NOCA|nr:TIGR02680 family protein [Rhodococcus triatomae]QNG18735.1 TIGR02680 family protein [Rhodococcus triatomae]QNG25355.1 TIGR02680 family protein [Rhodococcus triatomae]SDI88188.1 TIGR02680 family protein [Rhodococcus triatomae]
MTNSARFRPTRAGIINLWDYEDQEFCFADGRLVLRGPNGSGKTKALEVLFPFVLDGRIEPRRLNPFAGEERTMKSNLLYRGQDSAYSYVWMEFCRGPEDDPEAVTVGIGMRAARTADKVTRWYFVADGRVGVDFSLLADDDRPLTRRQLAEALGSDSITDRPVDYRASIDARMFGLGRQRYDQLINLVLTLRRPQLAKNLDPKGLSRALTDGLRPLDENLVMEAARSFTDMEDVARALEGLAAADSATTAFLDVYTNYLRRQVRADVEQLTTRLEAVDAATRDLASAAAERDAGHRERDVAAGDVEAAEHAVEQARAQLEALQQSSAYKGKEQLDDLAQYVESLQERQVDHERRAERLQAATDARAAEAEESRLRSEQARAALTRAESDLSAAAVDAGIEWIPRAEAGAVSDAVRAHAAERDDDIRAVRDALTDVGRATAVRDRAQEAAHRSQARLADASAEVAGAEAAVDDARSQARAALRRWWVDHSSLYESPSLDHSPGSAAPLVQALEETLDRIGDADAPTSAGVLGEYTAGPLEQIRTQRQQARLDAVEARRTRDELAAEREHVAAEHDDAPSTSPASPTGDAGTALWRLVRFRDDVPERDAARIEAALRAANLLDARVLPDHEPRPGGDGSTELGRVLTPLPASARPNGRTLSAVLEVEDPTGPETDSLRAILDSVALDDMSAQVAVDTRGRFRLGIQAGAHVKDHAEYIGATARARRRAARIAEIDAALAGAEEALAVAESAETAAAARIAEFAAAAKALPRTGEIVAARRRVAESAGALRTQTELAESARSDLDRAVVEVSGRDRELASTGASRTVPTTPRALDSLSAAVRHFEDRGAAVVRLHRECAVADDAAARARERWEEARTDAADHAETAAADRERHDTQARRLATLRDSLGADAEQIDAEIASTRARVESGKTDERRARAVLQATLERISAADAAHTSAAATLLHTVGEAQSDAHRLAPCARPDVLALLGVPAADTEVAWPASEGAWSTPEQVTYRLTTGATGPGDAAILPDEVTALYRALDTATAAVSGGESARKSSRTALSAALQRFESQLTAAQRDYRLRWDAPDHLTVVEVQDEHGASSITDFAARIAAARADQELLLTDSERRILEDALLGGLAQQIHERTVEARALISRMGAEMRERKMSSGNTIGIHWGLADSLDDDARAVAKLLDRDATTLGAEELAAMRAHFAARIRTARAAHPERSYPEILSEALDYRRWRSFTFTLLGADGSEDRLTVARHSALSGGEQSVSLHLPLFAAAHVMLDSADPQAPRLLALDEAFAGVDENGRRELLGLTVQFDLDLFMTGYDLWVTHAEVPACAHYDLSHSAAAHAVSAVLMVWSSGELLAEHDGSGLERALGSPLRRRVLPAGDALEFVEV